VVANRTEEISQQDKGKRVTARDFHQPSWWF